MLIGIPCEPEDIVARELELTYLRDAEDQALRLRMKRRLAGIRQSIAHVERMLREMRKYQSEMTRLESERAARRDVREEAARNWRHDAAGALRSPVGTRR
jgi:outer membrane translocation and assembly module TamA